MGDVHSRKNSPFPSPTETVSSVAVSQPPHVQPPRSPKYLPPDQDPIERSKDGLLLGVDGLTKTTARQPRFSRGDSAEQVTGLTPITEDTRSVNEPQEDQGRRSQTLKELRRQMEELLVYQQMQQQQAPPAQVSKSLNDTPRKRRLSNTSVTDLPSTIIHPSSGSVGSGGTIKAAEPDSTGQTMDQTPSYPFPRVQKSAQSQLEEAGHRNQFRLKLPQKSNSRSQSPEQKQASVQPSTLPQGLFQSDNNATPDNSEFPNPDLCDLTLKLNADAGLEAWWSNLIDIMQSNYGAERVSLALPGDATDLENVPWGQKAVFNQYGSAPAEDSRNPPMPRTRDENDNDGDAPPETPIARTYSNEAGYKGDEPVASNLKHAGNASMRPPLSSRHSFAGFGYGKKQTTDLDRNHQLSKTNSIKSEKRHARIAGKSGPTEVKLSSTTQNSAKTQPGANEFARGSTECLRQAVFPLTRPLEIEPDPLIKRAGVVKLFGRTTPVILTREYSENSAQILKRPAQSPLDTVQITPGSEAPHAPAYSSGDPAQQESSGNLAPFGFRSYDEYEQVPQSPWSQSPAPSPAPRTNPDQNPFFLSHAVDESAFEKNPPSHDYSNTHPLEAIGIDQSKTIIHLPLLHRGQSNQASPSTLRFPVAVVSLLSAIVPYPPNLRKSLASLMPHLTNSFCLAQQYSQLERQLMSKVEIPRYGHLLGLGGTFSDASSELELVAGLSGHVSYSVGDESSMSARASVTSPSDRSSTKFSPAISNFGTPGFEYGQHIGLASATLSPAVTGRDNTDSYFPAQNSKYSRDNGPQYRPRLAKSKAKVVASNPPSPGKLTGNVPKNEESSFQDPTLITASPFQEMRPPSIVSPTQPSSRQASTNSFYAQLQRELPRPFSDTIAQLMLNSIPLHLFLAKPQSGEVIWTNAKFDAYRRSKPHEQKLRDPWQNIHSSERDHVSSEWENALRTGSQFTERVRVKRFNDETAYRWFIFRANPLLSATGEVLYWIGSFLDIHEQHIAELKATQEREKFATDAKYRAFSNSIPQVVFEATENRGLIFVNEQWNLYTGQELGEALDLGFAKHVHPDDLEKCGGLSAATNHHPNGNVELGKSMDAGSRIISSEIHGVSSALDELVRRGVASLQKDENGRVFYSTEIRLRSRGGDFRWHLVRLVRVHTSSFGSEEASWYGTCTDINDRKNLERELNKAMSQLNNQMESKTKFFSNMSHEIRTPLNGILGTIPFILDTQLDSDQRRMLDTIQNSSTNLRELVDNILDVSRVEAGKMSLVNSWFHVRSMIEDVIDTIASRAIDKGLEINYVMAADVPSMVIGDRFRIRQVLINLVGNAVKFTPHGEIHISCNLLHDENANIKISEVFLNFDVVDTGKGFSAVDAARLMQRFSQLGENGSQQNAGSGLGLFLSKQLVEMHGGKLTPSSMEGKGAKFSFNVKVDAPPPPSPSERPNLLRQASTASRRPTASRTTSYDQYSLWPSRGFDPKLQDTALLSPGLDSPASASHSPTFSSSATGSEAKTLNTPSVPSSALPTPDITTAQIPPLDIRKIERSPSVTARPQAIPETSYGIVSQNPVRFVPPPSDDTSAPTPTGSAGSPQGPLSIFILCPLDNTRRATKQHIEQVVPHEIPFKITTLPDVDEWKDLIQPGSNAQCTHLVLNLPATDEILDVIQHVSESDSSTAPVIVIISDLYQKRQISTRVKELAASGKKVFIVPKPVKPSAFSIIFDPDSKRELSKDRNQDMAREINNNFKTVSKMVKEVLGNKGYRILLVEDDETNRDVMLKYLDKIKLMSDTASNGQEALDRVFSKEPGYYSLIICDIQMPIKNGYDTCRDIRAWELKNHYPQIPIMALSANAMTDQIEDAARAGFNDYVTKPIKHNELGKMMMGLLDNHQPLLLLRDRLHPGNPQITSRR
ncbi:uncharacterized protein N7483_009728 [Penicillium malachiteum]|uniref:uncharacterized protein n=1 Tax=Penicillium malachiteum TaxID=1324776 RepID=UPI0025466A59|nr:uncharacterized protein N7483_009728 [Penicillium malachiteum]KAJ5721794.1 hypothetical protein N7483_009728 [Penicillium malachiteum]